MTMAHLDSAGKVEVKARDCMKSILVNEDECFRMLVSAFETPVPKIAKELSFGNPDKSVTSSLPNEGHAAIRTRSNPCKLVIDPNSSVEGNAPTNASTLRRRSSQSLANTPAGSSPNNVTRRWSILE